MFRGLFKIKNKNNRILIVEDDAMLSDVLSDRLKAEQFNVVVVDNGLKVLEETIRFAPNIILLDLILPGIDGFAVLEQLKEETKTKNIPVAVLSNLNTESDVKSAKALGAEEYFLKANTEMDLIVKFVKGKLK